MYVTCDTPARDHDIVTLCSHVPQSTNPCSPPPPVPLPWNTPQALYAGCYNV